MARQNVFFYSLSLPRKPEIWAKLIRIMYNILKYINTLERDFQPQMPHILGVASLALGVGSSILGGVSSANAARRAEKLRKEQDAKNAAWFNRIYNESYIDTAAGRNAIRQAQDFAKRQTQRAEGAAAVAGGTDAAVAQAKEGANKMIGDTIGNLAAQDTARKENAEATYQQQQENSTAWQMQNQQMRANAIAQAAQGASNALIQGASLLGESNGGAKTQANTTSSIPESAIAPTQAEQNALNSAFAKTAEANAAAQAAQFNKEYAVRHGLTTDEVTGKRRNFVGLPQ